MLGFLNFCIWMQSDVLESFDPHCHENVTNKNSEHIFLLFSFQITTAVTTGFLIAKVFKFKGVSVPRTVIIQATLTHLLFHIVTSEILSSITIDGFDGILGMLCLHQLLSVTLAYH